MTLQKSIVLLTFASIMIYQFPIPKNWMPKNFLLWNHTIKKKQDFQKSDLVIIQLPFFTFWEEKRFAGIFKSDNQ
jgi:hypothetical protein